ncbi:MAG: DNA mismatch repair protein MutS [Rhodospirillaceae bacterium]|nr:DNA mismatch repair protein MutS [Rhodospirillaceae bacterium]
MARRPRPIQPTEQDLELFQRVLTDVKPLFPQINPSGDEITRDDEPGSNVTERKTRQTRPLRALEQSKIRGIPVSLADHDSGHVPGLDRRTARRLQRGKIEISGRIDLHGMTKEEARAALAEFLIDGQRRGDRCLLVITGKGRRSAEGALLSGSGVLRRMVPRWLSEPPLDIIVLAYTPAQPADGGAGALYVLLKRRRGP